MSAYLFVHKNLLVLSHSAGTTDFKLQGVRKSEAITEKLVPSDFNIEHLETFCASKG
jgi:hypothetical protein